MSRYLKRVPIDGDGLKIVFRSGVSNGSTKADDLAS